MNIDQYNELLRQHSKERVAAATEFTERIRERADRGAEAVLDLHASSGVSGDQCAECFDWECAGQPAYWPCATINALAGAYGILRIFGL